MLKGAEFDMIERQVRGVYTPMSPYADANTRRFGGCSVILIGDIGQPPPVNGAALSKASGCPASAKPAEHGRSLFEDFTEIYQLDVVERLKRPAPDGADPAAFAAEQELNTRFTAVQLRLRARAATAEDFVPPRQYCGQTASRPVEDWGLDAQRLFTSNALCEEYNATVLARMASAAGNGVDEARALSLLFFSPFFRPLLSLLFFFLARDGV